MKRCYRMVLCFLLLACVSCAKPKPTPMPPVEKTPTYTQNFIKIHFKADSQVNLYDGGSHALHVCVYELSEPNGFNLLTEDQVGIAKLLSCDRPEIVTTIPGAANAKKFIIQPGDDRSSELDRAEGAKYIGIVAGYYTLQRANAVQLYTIPTVEEKKDGLTVITQKPFDIEVYLGPQSLQQLGGKP